MNTLRAFIRLYIWSAPLTFVAALRRCNGSAAHYFHWFFETKSFIVSPKQTLGSRAKIAAFCVGIGMLLQVIAGVAFLIEWARLGSAGYWEFGLALLISYPLVWGSLLGVVAFFMRRPPIQEITVSKKRVAKPRVPKGSHA